MKAIRHIVDVNNNNSLSVNINLPKGFSSKQVELILLPVEKKSLGNHSPALSGTEFSISEFKKWIGQAEKAPTISLSEAKAKWHLRKKELIKNSH
jgi:hypothetical protein